MPQPLIEVRRLSKHYSTKKGLSRQVVVKAVDEVSFELYAGETLGLVGESGCGKSTVGKTLLQLLPPTSGSVRFMGQEIAGMKGRHLRAMRQDMQMVFQDPYSSLDPRMTIGRLIAEPLSIHRLASGREKVKRIDELLELVGLSTSYKQRYVHELSGGQRQRIGIARALALHPKLIVADEAVSALDVSIQSQIINLLQDLQEQFGLAYLFISHNLSVVKHISNRIAVMYLGRIVETGETHRLFAEPQHPYTRALMSAIPVPDPDADRSGRMVLSGDVPNPAEPPQGCAFHPRCSSCMDICRIERPQLRERDGHSVACHLYEDEENEKERRA
ncbi:dipeptide ABC transporter ATP-binding protein [Paenibacillaceae bacterium]|nr:dipeptide ABC transporter ATP-binding protein [Paenibacillaceae bacterium]